MSDIMTQEKIDSFRRDLTAQPNRNYFEDSFLEALLATEALQAQNRKLVEALEGLLTPKIDNGYSPVMDCDRDCNGCTGKLKPGCTYHDEGCLVAKAKQALAAVPPEVLEEARLERAVVEAAVRFYSIESDLFTADIPKDEWELFENSVELLNTHRRGKVNGPL